MIYDFPIAHGFHVCYLCQQSIPEGRLLCRRLACRSTHQRNANKRVWADPAKRQAHSELIRERKRVS